MKFLQTFRDCMGVCVCMCVCVCVCVWQGGLWAGGGAICGSKHVVGNMPFTLKLTLVL